MTVQTGWDFADTVDPATGVLVNHLGAQDAEWLAGIERRLVDQHTMQLHAAVASGTLAFDLATWEKVHRHLFSDLYPWAGRPRTVDRPADAVADRELHFAPWAEIGTRMGRIAEVVADQDWATMAPEELPGQLGAVYVAAFHLRPFRDGNARSLMILTDSVAARAGRRVDWSRHAPRAWTRATAAAMPREADGRPDPRPVIKLLGDSLAVRPAETAPEAPAQDTTGSADQATFGAPPGEPDQGTLSGAHQAASSMPEATAPPASPMPQRPRTTSSERLATLRTQAQERRIAPRGDGSWARPGKPLDRSLTARALGLSEELLALRQELKELRAELKMQSPAQRPGSAAPTPGTPAATPYPRPNSRRARVNALRQELRIVREELRAQREEGRRDEG